MIGNGFDLKDNNRKLINALSSYLKVIYYDEDDKSMEDITACAFFSTPQNNRQTLLNFLQLPHSDGIFHEMSQ